LKGKENWYIPASFIASNSAVSTKSCASIAMSRMRRQNVREAIRQPQMSLFFRERFRSSGVAALSHVRVLANSYDLIAFALILASIVLLAYGCSRSKISAEEASGRL
jgi:hypothetical protein